MGFILIVEDDEQNHILMDSFIASMGHTALHAWNGQEGLNLADEHHPDLILLDMRLPLMDGWELASIISNDSQLKHIPIVAVSVRVKASDEERAMDAGCDNYIAKPFSLQLIRECINHYLG